MTKETAEDNIDKIINRIIGRNIYLYRTVREWPQEHLSRNLGVTAQEVQGYESGAVAVPLVELKRLSSLFGCTIDELVTDCHEDLAFLEMERPYLREIARVKQLGVMADFSRYCTLRTKI